MNKQEAWVLDINRIEYEEAFALQRKLVSARAEGRVQDTFILLEHHPVFTFSGEAAFKNIIAPQPVLDEAGIGVCRTDRGGDVTYHGPGQITGYSIMDLNDQGNDLHVYIRNMEQLLIDTLMDFGIESSRDPKHPGVWVGSDKIAAIGIAVKRGWITMHGFALNVDPNMTHYQYIIACGIVGKGVTSMNAVLGRKIETETVKEALTRHYGRIYGRLTRSVTREELPWS